MRLTDTALSVLGYIAAYASPKPADPVLVFFVTWRDNLIVRPVACRIQVTQLCVTLDIGLMSSFEEALKGFALHNWHLTISQHIQMMEHKSQHGVPKQLQEEEALKEVAAKEVEATMCNVTTATKICIRPRWQTTTERTGPLENRGPLACNNFLYLLHKHADFTML